ncbi:MAG TPA: hypothetical protein VH309_06785 [Elusimicrobiota bacterium]|nr:hypothetical protein [Elusimicrobiota bacterium]
MTRGRKGGLLLAAALAGLGAWTLVLRGQGRGIPLITDEGEYAVAARAWASGGLPYRDAFSQKPPFIFLFYRAAAAVSSSPESPRLAGAAVVLLTLLVLFLCAPRSWTAAGRLAAPAAFAALSSLPIGDYGFPANTETFLNLFAALSALAVLRGAPFLAGLAAGAALTTKQTAAWTVLGFGALAASAGGRFSRRGALRYALGAALIPGAWAAYFASRGALGDYWAQAWAGNARYASVLLATGALDGQLRWFATLLLPRLVLFSLPALLLAGWSLRGLRAGAKHPVETITVVWFGAAVAGALTGLFLFPHYFVQLAPALALGAGCGVERTAKAGRGRTAFAIAVLLAAWPALLAPGLVFSADARGRALALLYPNPLFETKVLGRELARRAAPGDRLHVFGSEGALFVYSGLAPATPHTLCYALTLFPKDASGWEAEMASLERTPPRFVVFSTQPLSTMTSSRFGLDYRAAMIVFLEKGYRYDGAIVVSPSLEPPAYAAAAKGEAPAFGSEDRLLLFVRR